MDTVKIGERLAALILFGVLCVSGGAFAHTGDQREVSAGGEDTAVVVRDLTSRDPLVRQRAAEELARLAIVDHRRLIEGYRWQEKDKRVRLALDWALYRMGKEEALFELVSALNSKLYTQAQTYLNEIESPQPLYKFLAQANGNIQIKLLETLARAGDAGTLELIKPYESSLDPKIAEAAGFASREITLRLTQTTPALNIRPRQASSPPPPTP